MSRRPSSFGGVEFDCVEVSDSLVRALEVTKHRNRNGAKVRDHGGMARQTDCQFIFWDRPAIDGETADASVSYRDRFNNFARLIVAGRARTFRHPGGGSYRAYVQELDWSEVAFEVDTIRGGCVFVEDTSETSESLATGTDRPRTSGIAEAKVFADTTRLELASTAPTADTTFLDDIDGFLAEWTDPTNIPEVPSQLRQSIRLIESAQAAVGVFSDPQYYELLVLTEQLAASLRDAAAAATRPQPQLASVVVLTAQPLRSFLVGYYGASEARDQYQSVLDLNVVDDPLLMPIGTELTLPVAGVGRRDLQGAA